MFHRSLRPSSNLAWSPLLKTSRLCWSSVAGLGLASKSSNLRQPEAFHSNTPRRSVRSFASKSKGPVEPSSTSPTQSFPKIPSARIRQEQHAASDGFSLVYVHPLSQLVLQYFQEHCHDWIRSKHLDHRLFLHRDGTFLMESNHNHYQSVLRIWTYYDTDERKHWLALAMNQVMHRFLLQDNTMKVWKGYQHDSYEERVHESVCDLMDSIDEMN